MHETLLARIQQHHKLSNEAATAIIAIAERIEGSAGDFLVKEGTICDKLYFLEKGCLRGFRYEENQEVTFWFAFENSFVTSCYSFYSGKPSYENIQLLEKSVLYAVKVNDLHQLYDKYQEIERAGRLINESYYVQLEERMFSMHFKTAKERYEQFVESNPQILQRVPLGMIASYLGITQETLSRIRRK
jgi:CRP-like cAMP-binding protein